MNAAEREKMMDLGLKQKKGAGRLFDSMFGEGPGKLLDEGRLALLKLMIQRFLSKPVANEVLEYFDLSNATEERAEFDKPTINIAVAELKEEVGDEIYELFECYDNVAEFILRILWGHNELKRENYLLRQRMRQIQKILEMDEIEGGGEDGFAIDGELQKILCEDVAKDPKLKIRIRDLSNSELSTRAKNCLLSGGLYTLGDVIQRTERDIRRLRGAGDICMTSIKMFLEGYGLGLKEDE